MRYPDSVEMYVPIFDVIAASDSPVSVEAMNNAVLEAMNLPTLVQQHMLATQGGKASLLYDRTHWARQYMKRKGYVTNPERGVWAFTQDFKARVEESFEDCRREILNFAIASKAIVPDGDFKGEHPE